MKRAAALLACAALLCAAEDLPLEGITPVAVRVTDAVRSRAFYQGVLGLVEPFEFKDNGRTTVAFERVNNWQYIELYPGLKADQPKFMHVCFETREIERVHQRLTERGLKPAAIEKGRAGNLLFALRDPDGQVVEFLQYLPGSFHSNAARKQESVFRITRIALPAKEREQSLRFWRDQLGFRLLLNGDLQVPGGRGERIALGAELEIQLMGLDTALVGSRDPDGIRIAILTQ